MARADRVYRTGVVEPTAGMSLPRDAFEAATAILLPYLRTPRTGKLSTWRRPVPARQISPQPITGTSGSIAAGAVGMNGGCGACLSGAPAPSLTSRYGHSAIALVQSMVPRIQIPTVASEQAFINALLTARRF